MKINSTLFRNILQLAKRIKPNTVLPVTDCYLLECSKGKAKITATNLEVTLVAEVATRENDKFKTIIDPLILNSLNCNAEVDIQPQSDRITRFQISDGKINPTVTIETFAVGDYLNLTEPKNKLVFKTKADLFSTIAEVSKFTTSDEMRPAMTGVNLICNDKTITIVASDGHKLIKRNIKTNIKQNIDVVLNRDFLKTISGSKINTELLSCFISDDKKHVTFEWFDGIIKYRLYCRTVNQQYPNFNAVIPSAPKYYFRIDRKLFLDTLKQALPYTNKTTNQISIDLIKMELCATNMDYGNKWSAKLHGTNNIEENTTPVVASFNARFLADVVSHANEKEIEIRFDVLTKPFTITENNDTLLIMPVIIY